MCVSIEGLNGLAMDLVTKIRGGLSNSYWDRPTRMDRTGRGSLTPHSRTVFIR